MDYVICLCKEPNECVCDCDTPRLGDYCYWPKYDAVVLVVDLILGEGVYDALVYCTDEQYIQTPTKGLVPVIQANAVSKATRKTRLRPHYQAQATWDQVTGPILRGTHNGRFSCSASPTKQNCSCDMQQLMRSGCACGGE